VQTPWSHWHWLSVAEHSAGTQHWLRKPSDNEPKYDLEQTCTRPSCTCAANRQAVTTSVMRDHTTLHSTFCSASRLRSWVRLNLDPPAEAL
jgi:hypothetical protein